MSNMENSRYAIVDDGTVINIVLWNGIDNWEPPETSECIKIGDVEYVSEGFKYSKESGFEP